MPVGNSLILFSKYQPLFTKRNENNELRITGMLDISAVQLHNFLAAATHSIDEPELVVRTYRSYEVLNAAQHLRGAIEATTRVPILESGELDYTESISRLDDRRQVESRVEEMKINKF